MNILFITKDRANQLENSTESFVAHLKKKVKVTIWNHEGDIRDILGQLPVKPDFILLNDFKSEYTPKIYGLNDTDIPKGAIFHDLHYKKFQRNKFIINENIDLVFTHYRDAFLTNFPDLASRMVWFPHAIDPGIFLDYHQPKTINFLLMGALYPVLYPFRNRIYRTLCKENGFVVHPHPGYRKISLNETGFLINQEYAKEINRSKIFLTCDSIYHYPLKKYFEVLACNTLLLAPQSAELTDLGFQDGVNFISINEEDFVWKANHYLLNEHRRKEIALAGHSFIHTTHTLDVRISQMLERVQKEILNRGV